jgi:hypothetical protein
MNEVFPLERAAEAYQHMESGRAVPSCPDDRELTTLGIHAAQRGRSRKRERVFSADEITSLEKPYVPHTVVGFV